MTAKAQEPQDTVQEAQGEPGEEQVDQETPEVTEDPQPTAERVTTQTDTTSADAVSPLPTTTKSGAPPMQIKRVKEYLDEEVPASQDPNRPEGEHPADTLIRIVRQQREALRAIQREARCSEQYCNKPAEHGDEHGWVNYG